MFHWVNIFNSASSWLMLSWACYPIIGAISILVSIICYRHLFKCKHEDNIAFTQKQPFISILVPAHNEQLLLSHTIKYLATQLNYDRYEIIICDDGSTDNTPAIASRLADRYNRVRVIHIMKNAGKAHAYNVAMGFANGQFIYSNDADTLPEPNCLWKFMSYFNGKRNQDVGAVTGNIGIINRSSSLSKAQLTEFTSIISGLKSAQNDYAGTQFAFSGASLMVRKDALIDCGGFSQSLDTEDIDLSWRMSKNGWESLFANNINSYVMVPTTISGIFRQRYRWAAGGTEVVLKGFADIIRHPLMMRQKFPILIGALISDSWCVLYWFLLAAFIYFNVHDFLNGYWTNWKYMWLFMFVIISFEFLFGTLQLYITLHYDNKGQKLKYIICCQMYLVFTWLINPITLTCSLPHAILVLLGIGGKNTWKSPRHRQVIKPNNVNQNRIN